MININKLNCLSRHFPGLRLGTALLGLGSLSILSQSCEEALTQKPNIIFILTDDLGYGDLSCQGGKDIRTPNIDSLFKKGVQFTHFYANSTVCSPTRASLLTGCYPDMVGVPGVIRAQETDSWGYLLPGAITLPDMLKKAGYQTGMIGKWNLGLESPNLPNDRGFEFFHGFLNDMMDDYWTHLREGKNYMRLNTREIDPKGHATDIFSDWAVDYILDKSKEKKPYFLYLAYNAPHFPIQPPTDWLEKVKQREGNIDIKRAKDIALVEHLDDGIGRVIYALKESGKYKNTIIIFTSDNGGHLSSGSSNGNLRGGKLDMYEGGIKVPACMVWEDSINAGTVCNTMGVMMDFYPTLCSIAGSGVQHKIDGIGLYHGNPGKCNTDDDRTLFFMRRDGGTSGGLCYYACRKGDYKLVQNTPFEEFQLFNIAMDPQEQKPLDVNCVQFNRLKSELSQHIRESGAIPWQKNTNKY